jgi:hypothetical protein
MITLLVFETRTNSLPQSKHTLNDGTQTCGYLDKYFDDFQILFVHNKLAIGIIVIHFQVTMVHMNNLFFWKTFIVKKNKKSFSEIENSFEKMNKIYLSN